MGFSFQIDKKMQLRPLSPLTGVANATFSFVPYMQTINLVTTFDLVTLFGLTKSVTKSEVDCTYLHVIFGPIFGHIYLSISIHIRFLKSSWAS